MITAPEAIEQLADAGVAKVDLNNEQPHRPKIDLASTLEMRAAELISHQMRRIQELLEANNAYLERAREAERKLDQKKRELDWHREATMRAMVTQADEHADLQDLVAGSAPLTARTFRSMLATLQNIERHEIEAAGWTMTTAAWKEFQQHPWKYFLQTGDQCRDAIMKIVFERNGMAAQSEEQKKHAAEMAVAWFNEPLRATDLERLQIENAELQKATGAYADANTALIKDLKDAEAKAGKLLDLTARWARTASGLIELMVEGKLILSESQMHAFHDLHWDSLRLLPKPGRDDFKDTLTRLAELSVRLSGNDAPTDAETLRDGLQQAADALSKRIPELRGPFPVAYAARGPVNVQEFKPCVIHFAEGNFSQILIEGCPTITGQREVSVEPLFRAADGELVGFQWSGGIFNRVMDQKP